MIARIVLSLAVVALTGVPSFAQPPKKADITADLINKLRAPCDLKPGEAPLELFTDELSKMTGIAILINDNALGGGIAAGCKAEGPTIKIPRVKGLPVGVVLRHCLGQIQATYLVRKSYVEIVSISAANRETKNNVYDEGLADDITMRAPLVSAILKEKPLNDAIADLADEFELTVVVAPQAGDNRMAFVNARLLNVPADDAIELLAAQADLRVVRQGNTYLITSPDHANQLFEEKIARQMKHAELERLRALPFGLGGPPQPLPDK